MLKKICKLFLGLVVCASSACVTPTHASSAPSVIITSIQAGGASGAKEEAIVLYNSTPADIVLTNWCLINKSNTPIGCFAEQTETSTRAYTLPALSYATIVSKEYAARAQLPESTYSLVYTPLSSSSGSLTGSSDSVSLINAEGEEIDTKAWTVSLAAGKLHARLKIMTNPDTYAQTGAPADWGIDTKLDIPVSGVLVIEKPIVPPENPIEPEDEPGDTTPPSPVLPSLYISEILPNPVGADTGGEFIELFNPHETEAFQLQNIRIRIGIDTPKWYTLPVDTLQPGEYRAYYNQSGSFTLVNTIGRVQLFNGSEPIGDSIDYSSPKEGQSWSLVEDAWAYTHPSPGVRNTPGIEILDKDEGPDALVDTEKKPCAAHQYRNPETGRCKSVATATQPPAACKPGQERNPETGRCRTIAAVKGVAACKEGQERNPETNRCRTIVKMTKATHGLEVKQGVDTQPKWYYWLTFGLLVTSIAAYAIWEWREELTKVWGRARSLLTK